MKTIAKEASTTVDAVETKDGLWKRIANRLAKANIKTSRWSRWASDVYKYWVHEWWHNTNGVVAKTVKLVHDVWDYLSYNAMSWTGGLICVCILF